MTITDQIKARPIRYNEDDNIKCVIPDYCYYVYFLETLDDHDNPYAISYIFDPQPPFGDSPVWPTIPEYLYETFQEYIETGLATEPTYYEFNEEQKNEFSWMIGLWYPTVESFSIALYQGKEAYDLYMEGYEDGEEDGEDHEVLSVFDQKGHVTSLVKTTTSGAIELDDNNWFYAIDKDEQVCATRFELHADDTLIMINAKEFSRIVSLSNKTGNNATVSLGVYDGFGDDGAPINLVTTSYQSLKGFEEQVLLRVSGGYPKISSLSDGTRTVMGQYGSVNSLTYGNSYYYTTDSSNTIILTDTLNSPNLTTRISCTSSSINLVYNSTSLLSRFMEVDRVLDVNRPLTINFGTNSSGNFVVRDSIVIPSGRSSATIILTYGGGEFCVRDIAMIPKEDQTPTPSPVKVVTGQYGFTGAPVFSTMYVNLEYRFITDTNDIPISGSVFVNGGNIAKVTRSYTDTASVGRYHVLEVDMSENLELYNWFKDRFEFESLQGTILCGNDQATGSGVGSGVEMCPTFLHFENNKFMITILRQSGAQSELFYDLHSFKFYF